MIFKTSEMFLKTIDNDFAQGLIRAFGGSHEKKNSDTGGYSVPAYPNKQKSKKSRLFFLRKLPKHNAAQAHDGNADKRRPTQ